LAPFGDSDPGVDTKDTKIWLITLGNIKNVVLTGELEIRDKSNILTIEL
jgi:hypothetical protein